MELNSLFDDEFAITINKKKSIKDLVKTINDIEELDEDETEKVLKSDHYSLEIKLAIIHDRIIKILGKQRKNIVVIKTKEQLHDYITAAIDAGRIDIDTETNNSLDPITCKLMGPCLYYPGGKQAYVPINHRNWRDKTRLEWQVTEADFAEEMQRLVDTRKDWVPDFTSDVFANSQSYTEYWVEHVIRRKEKVKSPLIVFHNAKFDYEVIHCTCGVDLYVDWDTMICQRLMDENDLAGLKYLYTRYIDQSQAKYNLESLYGSVQYADSDPDIFALYAATDALMTDRVLMEHQLEHMIAPEQANLFKLFTRVELPLVYAIASQELIGMKVDVKYGEKLSVKYHALLDEVDSDINKELDKLSDKINAWKLSTDANLKVRQYVPAKSKMSLEKIEKTYNLIDEKGNRYRLGKPKVDQLDNPLTAESLGSTQQLAIILYDVLKVPVIDKESPRGTGGDILEEIDKAMEIPLLKLILKRRGYVKLLSTYIDNIPVLAQHWPDGRIRAHMNQLGTDTGRLSSGGGIAYVENYGTVDEKRVEENLCNLQNIPSYTYNIRPLFTGDTIYTQHEANNGTITISEYEEVETNSGYKYPRDLNDQDQIITDEGNKSLVSTKYDSTSRKYLLILGN